MSQFTTSASRHALQIEWHSRSRSLEASVNIWGILAFFATVALLCSTAVQFPSRSIEAVTIASLAVVIVGGGFMAVRNDRLLDHHLDNMP